MITLSERAQLTGGRSSGFDYLRMILSVSVVLIHTTRICYGINAEEIYFHFPLRPFFKIIMPMFFALSGYLVAGSLVRSKTMLKFLGLRFIRIYPALIVEVLLSAFLIGPLLTKSRLGSYFSDHEFYRYMLNVTGDIHYNLPGLFEANPSPSVVNGQLWTIPYELLCYVSLLLLGLVGIVKQRNFMLFIIPSGTIICFAAKIIKNGGVLHDVGISLPGQLLVVAFLSGVAFYLYANVVPWNKALAICALALTVVLLSVPNAFYLAPVPVAYLTVYLGLTNFPRAGLLKHADLSYGIFLYGFVVQQAVSYLLPWSREWYLNFLISLPVITAVAAFSWHFVERPALELRHTLMKLESWYLSKVSSKEKTFHATDAGH